MLLNPENTLFVRGGTPVLLLADAPVHDALPLLTASDGAVPLCEGWNIVPRLTLCVVDGPGDHGLVVPLSLRQWSAEPKSTRHRAAWAIGARMPSRPAEQSFCLWTACLRHSTGPPCCPQEPRVAASCLHWPDRKSVGLVKRALSMLALRALNSGPLHPEATRVGALPWGGRLLTCIDGPHTFALVRRCSSALSRS